MNPKFCRRLLVVIASLCAVFLPFYSATASSFNGQTLDLGDIKIYLKQKGKGEPIIFLHGGMGSADSWALQVEFFSKHFWIITPDSRGQGRTTDTNTPLSYHLMAEDVIKLMDKLKIASATIVGWSDGGNIGIDLAIHHPNRIKGIVAYGANINPQGLQPHFLDYLRKVTPIKMQQDNGGDYLALSPTPEKLPIIAEKIRQLWLNEPRFSAKELASIKAPVLIIDGDQEELIRRDHAKEIAMAIPNSKLIMLPNVGHYATFQRPEEWNKAVFNFITHIQQKKP